MTGWLLDTNILSELRRPKPERKVLAFIAAHPLEQLYVSAVTFAEIRFGIELVADASRRAELNDWLAHKAQTQQSCHQGPFGRASWLRQRSSCLQSSVERGLVDLENP